MTGLKRSRTSRRSRRAKATTMGKNHQTAVEIVRKVAEKTPEEVSVSYQKLLREFEKGLPVASSGEVLNRRVKW